MTFSIARVRDDWYVACLSRELGRRPRTARIFETPLVLFRDDQGRPSALFDRCAHRNAPLSIGRVTASGRLACAYHGWEFDREGTCRLVPGLLDPAEGPSRSVPSFPCREQDGFVWIYATPEAEPDREPFRFPFLNERGYVTLRHAFLMKGTLHAVAENALDVPHTAFLHRGLFRGNREPCEIEVVVKRWDDRVEAEYRGEPRPSGLVGRLLAPGGGIVTHFDRFFLPSIAQVEYRLGERSHLCVSTALTPVGDFETQLFSALTFRLAVPGRPLVPFLRAIARSILKQDAWILNHQTAVIRRFEGEEYASTELDALGPHILRLLRDAESGRRERAREPSARTFRAKI